MAWSASKIFVETVEDMLNNTTALDLGSDGFNCTLWDNDITPSQTVTSANTAYGVDQWVTTGNEVFEAGQWAQAGVALASVTWTSSSNVITWDAADTASGAAADLANVYGVHLHDTTVTTPVDNQGICYNYAGGANSVVNGTMTIVWNGSGILALTL